MPFVCGFFQTGEFPERSNGADCKSVGSAFEGSNPPLPKKGGIGNTIPPFFYSANKTIITSKCGGRIRTVKPADLREEEAPWMAPKGLDRGPRQIMRPNR